MQRNGYKWSINEILQLQRESELLGLSVFEIAKIHKRSVDAIIYKVAGEGFLVNQKTIQSSNKLVKRKESGQGRMQLRSGA
jgi:hypothetical protein